MIPTSASQKVLAKTPTISSPGIAFHDLHNRGNLRLILEGLRRDEVDVQVRKDAKHEPWGSVRLEMTVRRWRSPLFIAYSSSTCLC